MAPSFSSDPAPGGESRPAAGAGGGIPLRQARRVETIYSHYAGFYDVLFDRILDPGRRAAVQRLRIGEGDRVLEIGIGTGLSLRYFPACAGITGVDISSAMLSAAARRVADLRLRNVDLLHMDAARLEFPADGFDAVLLPYVLSTVPDPAGVLDETIRVSRRGARIAILNHFGSRRGPARRVERTLTPVTERIGFRLDLPETLLTTRRDLEVIERRRVNFLRLWKLFLCVNRKSGEGSRLDSPPAFG